MWLGASAALCRPKMGPDAQGRHSLYESPRPDPASFLCKRRERKQWISPATWLLVDERAALPRSPARKYDQAAYHRLSRQIRQSLKEEACLKEARGCLQAWYQHAGDKPHKPSHEDLHVLTREREDLYLAREPPGDPIPIVLPDPFALTDGPPSSWLALAVQRLPRGKSPGPSGIHSDDLKM